MTIAKLRPHAFVLAAFVITAVGAELGGCGFDQQHLRAAHDLQCASDKLEVTQIDDDRTRYAGCGKSEVYFCTVNTHGYTICSLEKPNPREKVQEVAGADFGCPKEKIVIDDVGANYSAKGCNRSDVYSCSPVLSSFRCVRAVASPASASASAVPSATPATSR